MNKSMAQVVAEQLGDDGQRFETADGRTLKQLTENTIAVHGTGRHRECVRYTFDDGSVIAVQGSAWDLGFPDCFCWSYAGHSEDCHNRALKVADVLPHVNADGELDGATLVLSDGRKTVVSSCDVEHDPDDDVDFVPIGYERVVLTPAQSRKVESYTEVL